MPIFFWSFFSLHVRLLQIGLQHKEELEGWFAVFFLLSLFKHLEISAWLNGFYLHHFELWNYLKPANIKSQIYSRVSNWDPSALLTSSVENLCVFSSILFSSVPYFYGIYVIRCNIFVDFTVVASIREYTISRWWSVVMLPHQFTVLYFLNVFCIYNIFYGAFSWPVIIWNSEKMVILHYAHTYIGLPNRISINWHCLCVEEGAKEKRKTYSWHSNKSPNIFDGPTRKREEMVFRDEKYRLSHLYYLFRTLENNKQCTNHIFISVYHIPVGSGVLRYWIINW